MGVVSRGDVASDDVCVGGGEEEDEEARVDIWGSI